MDFSVPVHSMFYLIVSSYPPCLVGVETVILKYGFPELVQNCHVFHLENLI
jgi:hypothetical protein